MYFLGDGILLSSLLIARDLFYTEQELVIGLKLGYVKSGIRDYWSSSDHREMFSGDRASVYCPGSSDQTLSSVIATCHSDLAVVIIPCNREHVA